MIKQTFLAGALLISTHSARAQIDDPTFNGIVARATCYIRSVTSCQAASCEQVVRNCQGDLCGTFSLFLKTRQFSVSVEKKALKIVDISPAEVGKPLWVKFEVGTQDNKIGEGRLTLKPERISGGYSTTAVIYVPESSDPASRSFSLINYECDAMSDEP